MIKHLLITMLHIQMDHTYNIKFCMISCCTTGCNNNNTVHSSKSSRLGRISSLEVDFINNAISGLFKACQILWINKGKMDDT